MVQRRVQDGLDCRFTFLSRTGTGILHEKTVLLPVTRKKTKSLQFQLLTQPIQRILRHRFLRVILTSQLSWAAHINYMMGSAEARVNIVQHLTGPRCRMSTSSRLTVHRAIIQQMASDHLPVLKGICPTSENMLQGALARSLKVCLGEPVATFNCNQDS